MIIPGVVSASEVYYSNYYGISMTEGEYNNLLQLGFTKEEIHHMEVEEFNSNKNIEGNLETTTTRYFVSIIRYDSTGKMISNSDMEISEEDYNNESILSISNRVANGGYVETSYKRMETTIAAAGSKYRYKVTLNWKIMPATRSYDIIGIGFNPTVYLNSSLVFNQTSCVSTNCTNTTTINNSNVGFNGAGVSFKLPTSTSITTLRSYFYFDVSKNVSNTITSMYAYGDYSHATKTISGGAAQGYYVDQSGIVLSSEISSYYDTITTADASWYGSW